MLPTLSEFSLAKLGRLAATVLLGAALAACGGGGGSPGGSGAVGGGTTPTGPAAKDPAMTLAIVDGSGQPVTTLSGGQSATVKATVTTSAGAPAAGAVVQFTASDSTLLQFTPVSGSALSDSTGVAVISIKPGSFTASGALTVKATAVVESKTATASSNIAVGAAPLTVGALSFSPTPSGPLPAFSTLALNIPVSSGGQPVTAVDGLTMSSLCVGDGSATLVRGSIANGIQMATYTNNGCLRGNDLITVSIGNSTQTISVAVSSANIGAIQFAGSNVTGMSIVLKGSGGLGRAEAAQLTFRVVDQHNNGLAAVDVNFTATTYTGGLTVTPSKATTDVNGNVTTMVSSGTIPTPVRVVAEASRNGVTISGLSDTLTISTGLPIQRFMSMSADALNIEGLEYDNTISNITVLLADQYGNRVSDGTAVNLVTEGGAVGSSAQGACTTTGGGCTVQLRSQDFRPLNGRVTVLSYLQGIEDFVDVNGDGQYSCTNFVDASGAVPPNYRPLVDTCVSGGEPFSDLGDAFLDAGNLGKTSGVVAGNTLDGTYEFANGDLPFPYGHTGYSATGNGKWGINYIRRSLEMTFSGSTPTLVRQFCDSLGNCRDWSAADGDPSVIVGLSGTSCSIQPLAFRIFDVNNNPMPKGTTVSAVDSDKISAQTFSPDTVPSTNAIGGTIHKVNIKPSDKCESGVLAVKVLTPKGIATLFPFKTN